MFKHTGDQWNRILWEDIAMKIFKAEPFLLEVEKFNDSIRVPYCMSTDNNTAIWKERPVIRKTQLPLSFE